MKNIGICFLIALVSLSTSGAEVTKGSTFPSPKTFGVTGEIPTTINKVVLYDFWASWCQPCRQAFPAYDMLYKKYKDQGLIVVGVGTDKESKDSAGFLKRFPPSFPVIFDHSQRFVAKVRPKGMPAAYLVGKDGKVVFIHAGFRGAKTVKILEAQIQNILK
ncbi:MAG: TlpA disulfide reductase family protein [Akkermansiaceae bacterium]|nr:TlpA disulfide reductase family protein [Akkermansiaceae bacterium]